MFSLYKFIFILYFRLIILLFLCCFVFFFFFFFSSRRRHTRSDRDWSSDVCSSDLESCSSILWKTWDYKEQAAEVLKLTATDLQELNVDRKSVVQGKSVDFGGRRIIKKKKKKDQSTQQTIIYIYLLKPEDVIKK